MNQPNPYEATAWASLVWAETGWQVLAAAMDATIRGWSAVLGSGSEARRSWYRPPLDQTAFVRAWLAPWQAWSAAVPGYPAASWPGGAGGWSVLNPAFWVLPTHSQTLAPVVAGWSAFIPSASFLPWLTMLAIPTGGATAATLARLPAAVAVDFATAYRTESGFAMVQINWPTATSSSSPADPMGAWLQMNLDLALAPFGARRLH